MLDFAIKTTRSLKVTPNNWPRYETYLLKAIRANPTTIYTAVQIFANYRFLGYPLDLPRIKKLVIDLVRRCAPTGSHSEVAWALFLAKALKLTLPAKDMRPVSELESSVCALIALDLRSLGLIDGVLDTSLWQQGINGAGLTSGSWLLAYEADIKGWLTSAVPNHVDAHPYFSVLKKYGVSFYDTSKNVKQLKKEKPKKMSKAMAEYLSASQSEAFANILGLSLAP